MKKKDLYTFMHGLNEAKFEHPRMTYAVTKNKRLVEEVLKDMEKSVEPAKEFSEFIKTREELAVKYSELDENGKPKMSPARNGQMEYVVIGQNDEKSAYRKELVKLEKKYEEEIKAHKNKVQKYNTEFLEEDTEFNPFTIALEFMETHEKCPQHIMDRIYWMIKE